MIDEKDFIRTIDEFLIELGTSSIIDARVARDQLMDLRLILMASIEIPDTVKTKGKG